MKLKNIKQNRLDPNRMAKLQEAAEFENAVRDNTHVTYENGTVITTFDPRTGLFDDWEKVFHIMDAKTREVKAHGDEKLSLENAVCAASNTNTTPFTNPLGRKTVSLDMTINRDKLNKTHRRATTDDVLYAATLYGHTIIAREEEAMNTPQY